MKITKTKEISNAEPVFQVQEEVTKTVENNVTPSQIRNNIINIDTEVKKLNEIKEKQKKLLKEIESQLTEKEKKEIDAFNNTQH